MTDGTKIGLVFFFWFGGITLGTMLSMGAPIGLAIITSILAGLVLGGAFTYSVIR